MTQEEEKQLKQDLKNKEERLKKLEDFVESLKSETTIPLDVGVAFQARVGATPMPADPSVITAFTQHVNEAGSDSYDVLKLPNRMVSITIEGKAAIVPDYST